jgi:ribosomal protein L11 methylase PrmA
LTRSRFSRLLVPRKSGDDAVLGLLALHAPLGFETDGRDLVAFFREASAARTASSLLRSRGIRHELTTDIAEGDPLEAFRAASRAFNVGRTGEHASTRLALLALEEEAVQGRSVLDVGTGSGVLALAAAGLGARLAIGLDIDAEAIFVARDNVLRHAFGIRVRLYAGPLEAAAGRFDLVLANMLAEEILPEEARLRARTGPSGRILLSGVTREREEDILGKMRRRRWKLAGRRSEREWVCLCLARAS